MSFILNRKWRMRIPKTRPQGGRVFQEKYQVILLLFCFIFSNKVFSSNTKSMFVTIVLAMNKNKHVSNKCYLTSLEENKSFNYASSQFYRF